MVENFKPALLFLAKFLGVYFLGNIVYGLYIESCANRPDVFTNGAANQTANILHLVDAGIYSQLNENGPTVFVRDSEHIWLNIYEGCNGLNVMIVFVAFLVAFGGPLKKLVWFVPMGLLILHIANLGRLALLYFVTLHYEQYFYFVHKYFFTAILYLIVFILWIIWVARLNRKSSKSA
jgi:exosortase family protein XrtF